MKKTVAILLVFVFACGVFAGCAENKGNAPQTSGVQGTDSVPQTPAVGSNVITVGISLPDEEQARWKKDAEIMENSLKAAGYDVMIRYAGNDVSNQNFQIEELIQDCRLLIIAAIDGAALSHSLYYAEQAQIPVIAYETPITNSEALSCCVTFDYYDLGIQLADYIFDQFDIYSTDGLHTVELAAGDPEDWTDEVIFNGAIDQLTIGLNDGKLIIKSQQTKYRQAAANAGGARERMNTILSEDYSDGTVPDAIICTGDAVAREVTAALNERGTGSWPVITGVGCEQENVINIYKGKQSMSLCLNTSAMALRTAEVAIAFLTGEELCPDAIGSYGLNAVPVFLERGEPVSKDNLSYLFEIGAYRSDLFQ